MLKEVGNDMVAEKRGACLLVSFSPRNIRVGPSAWTGGGSKSPFVPLMGRLLGGKGV